MKYRHTTLWAALLASALFATGCPVKKPDTGAGGAPLNVGDSSDDSQGSGRQPVASSDSGGSSSKSGASSNSSSGASGDSNTSSSSESSGDGSESSSATLGQAVERMDGMATTDQMGHLGNAPAAGDSSTQQPTKIPNMGSGAPTAIPRVTLP